ncbi:DUF2157 domain-containing protein [Pyruvatibacter mobilis]|uniref:DUF2157 domain-containing protein n=1 Tax=Pyruvatibacter mobilis TaxID=1712261 RepID=UPI003D126F4E
MILRQAYLRRLRDDLDRWAQKGLVDPARIPAILKEAEGSGSERGLTSILAVLGVILLGFAAMSFVAANWGEMSKLAKLLILFGGMWASLGVAIWQVRANGTEHPIYAEAAILLAVSLFGVAIMLIGQMYHVGGEYSGGLMLWMAGALVTAWLAPSRAALALAIILAPAWSLAALMENPASLHWQFVIPMSLAGLLVAEMGWRAGAHLLLIAWGVWATITGVWLVGEREWTGPEAFAVGTLFAILVTAKGHLPLRLIAPFEDAMIHWGLLAALGSGVLMLLASEDAQAPLTEYLVVALIFTGAAVATIVMGHQARRLTYLDATALAAMAFFTLAYPYLLAAAPAVEWLLVIALFAAAIWAVSYGMRTHDRFSTNLGFVLFAGMALYVYLRTVGTLLDTSLVFIIGGLLLIGLSIGIARVRRQMLTGSTGTGDAS